MFPAPSFSEPLLPRLVVLLAAASAAPSQAVDFPQFRGPSGNGVVQTADPPLNWGAAKGVAWRTALPGSGWSQPVVGGDLLFVTAAVGDKLPKPKNMESGSRDPASMPLFGAPKPPKGEVQWQVLALDAKTGSIRWSRVAAEGNPKFAIHPSNTYATETPCIDGERVYAYFGATGTVVALDRNSGEAKWKVELGTYPISNAFGSGSSPALAEGRLFISSFNQKNAFLVALDAKTGRELWRKERKVGSAWASPIVWKNSKRSEVVACGDRLVTSHDPASGEELWRIEKIDTAFAPSPTFDGDMLIMGASSPFSSSPLYGVRAGGSGDLSLKSGEKSNRWVAWFSPKGKIGMSSPVAGGGYAYFASNGILACYDVKTGANVYTKRLPGANRMAAASLMLVGDRLLLLDEAGKATWIKAGPKFETVGGGAIDDVFWASPALAGDRLFLRGVDALYCIGKQ